MTSMFEIAKRGVRNIARQSRGFKERFTNPNERYYYSSDRLQRFVAYTIESSDSQGLMLNVSGNRRGWSTIMSIQRYHHEDAIRYSLILGVLKNYSDGVGDSQLVIRPDGEVGYELYSGRYSILDGDDIDSVRTRLLEKGLFQIHELPNRIDVAATAQQFLIQFADLDFGKPQLIPLREDVLLSGNSALPALSPKRKE